MRAFDTISGLEEHNLDCSVSVTLGPSGQDVTNQPLPAVGIRAFPMSGGSVRVEWPYPVVNRARVPTGFNIYIGTGGTPNYSSPAATVLFDAGIANSFVCNLTGLSNGTTYTDWRQGLQRVRGRVQYQHGHRHGRCDWSISRRPAYRHRNILIYEAFMSLSAAPTFTPGSPGNLVPSQTCTSGTPVTATFAIGLSGDSGAQGSITTGSAVSGRIQVWSKGGSSVSSTNGCLVQVFSTSDGTNYDTVPFAGVSFVIANSSNAQYFQSFELPPGQYKLSLSNLDTTYSITVEATLGTIA